MTHDTCTLSWKAVYSKNSFHYHNSITCQEAEVFFRKLPASFNGKIREITLHRAHPLGTSTLRFKELLPSQISCLAQCMNSLWNAPSRCLEACAIPKDPSISISHHFF